MRKWVFISFVLLLIPSLLWAACTGSSPTWTTDGNESADVAECVTAATAGDTINVIAGDGAATWAAAAVTIPADKPLKIIGPGKTNLTITLDGHYAFVIMPYTGESPGTRISGFKFLSPTGVHYAAIDARGKYWRIDNCEYEDQTPISTTAIFVQARGINAASFAEAQPYGVIDNNTIINGLISHSGTSNSVYQQKAWNDAFDLGGSTAVYIEDNIFTTTGSYKHLALDINWGGKAVLRYNTLTNYDMMAHGVQNDGNIRGSRKWEVYGNLWSVDSGISIDKVLEFRAGSGLAFFNLDSSATLKYTGFTSLIYDRTTADLTYGGLCNGSSYFDGNTPDQSGWPCRDQVGVSIDEAEWTSVAIPDEPQTDSETNGPTQTKAPAYFWVNKLQDGSYPATIETDAHYVSGRDYLDYDTSFDGTIGVGCGTLAARPATCTTGVAYWATAQSTSDLTGMVGPSPATPISGTLYKCTSTDTWTSYYTSYTYPHPLRDAGGATTYELTTEKIGTGNITSTPAGISCDDTCSHTYDADTVVTLTAISGPGYWFKGWSDACSGTALTAQVTMSEARNCRATFVVDNVTLGGTGTGTLGGSGTATLAP